MTKVSENPRRIFFRGTVEEAEHWTALAEERGTTVDAMMREAAELYELIPPDRMTDARAMLTSLSHGRSARSVAVTSGPERALVEELLRVLRAGDKRLRGVLRAAAGK